MQRGNAKGKAIRYLNPHLIKIKVKNVERRKQYNQAALGAGARPFCRSSS